MPIDLSLPLEEGMPGFPAYPGFSTEQLQTYEEDDKVSHHFSLNSHQGTHVDAPAHFEPDGATIDDLDLDLFLGPARVLDLREHRGEKLTADVLEAAAPDLDGERVITLTGDVDYRFGDEDFFDEAAVLTADAAEWLVERNVPLWANDFLSESIRDPARPVHHTLLGAGIPIVEYLCNADAIADFDTVEFTCLPLRIAGFESAPTRAVAHLPDE